MQNFKGLAQKLWICTPPLRNGDGIWDSPFSAKILSRCLLLCQCLSKLSHVDVMPPETMEHILCHCPYTQK